MGHKITVRQLTNAKAPLRQQLDDGPDDLGIVRRIQMAGTKRATYSTIPPAPDESLMGMILHDAEQWGDDQELRTIAVITLRLCRIPKDNRDGVLFRTTPQDPVAEVVIIANPEPWGRH